jgi:SAM-dependent methyltransferase
MSPTEPFRDEEPEPGDQAVGEAFASHRAQVESVLPTNDPAAIKQLYVDFGEMLESAVGVDVDKVPLLSFPETGEIVLSLIGSVRGRVLDAGCGPNPGVSIMLGRQRKTTVVAIDIGLAMVRLARARAASAGVRLLAVVADVEALPFKDGSFQGCVCDDTIEHLPNDRTGIAELARVSATGARLVLATPNRVRLDVLRARWIDRRRGIRRPPSAYYAASSHLREYTWARLEKLVRLHFRVIGRATIGWSGSWKGGLAGRLVRIGPLRRWGRMVILLLEPA